MQEIYFNTGETQSEMRGKYNPEGSTLRKAQLRMLDILVVVDNICKKHHIDYWLEGGTLIGAVRHKGFIPWDDDLDIFVKNQDYKRLRKILQNELPADLVFQDDTTDPKYCLKIGKVRDRNSIVDDSVSGGISARLKEKGIFIDIIPSEPVIGKKSKKFVEWLYGRVYRRLHNSSDKQWEKVVAYFLWLPAISCVVTLRLLARILQSKKWDRVYGWCHVAIIKEADLFPTKPIMFEGKEFPAPNNPDKVLRTVYGNYMQVPPVDKREVHSSEITFLN